MLGNDLNNWKRLGTFEAIGNNPDPVTTNAPPDTDSWGVVTVLSANNTSTAPAIQLFNPLNHISGGTRPLYYRFFRDVWTEWRKLAFATPPQEFSLPLSAGWETQSGGDAKYFKTQEDIVHVSMNVKSNAAVAAGDTIATLPAGFRPASQLKIPIICKVSGQGALKFGHFDVGHDGGIRIYDAVTGSEIVTEIAVAPFAFDAAG